MKNITSRADEDLIDAARERARADHATFNEQFRLWLGDYVQRQSRADAAMSVIAELFRGQRGCRT